MEDKKKKQDEDVVVVVMVVVGDGDVGLEAVIAHVRV